jgi:hypothetical protein
MTRYRAIAGALGLCLFLSIAWSAEELPSQLSDEAFWKLVTEFSETGGSFPSDNWVSNEQLFQHVLEDLTEGRKLGGAYLGVGPDQNFTYIVALKPKIAFIFDIRRQNLVQHLMFKAIFELSADRAEFLSRLFSRPRPPEVGKDSTVEVLFDSFRSVPPNPQVFADNLKAIRDQLNTVHGFKLTTEDDKVLEYVFRAFYAGGPNLTYRGPRVGNVRGLPTYEELMMEGDKEGDHRSYMATEDNYLTLRQLEKNNLLVPLVADFAGPTAIRSVAQYLKDHNTTVNAFYTSNVEQYLFLTGDSWVRFYMNVSTLPLNSESMFIRSLIYTGQGYSPLPVLRSGFRIDNDVSSIPALDAAFNAGMIHSYADVIQIPQ